MKDKPSNRQTENTLQFCRVLIILQNVYWFGATVSSLEIYKYVTQRFGHRLCLRPQVKGRGNLDQKLSVSAE